MKHSAQLIIISVLALGLSTAGCDKKKEEATGAAPEGSAKTVATDDKGADPKSDPKPVKPAKADGPPTRAIDCKFIAWKGEGDDKQASFTLANISGKPIKRVQTWIYYYKEGKQFDRYPHALHLKVGAGEKTEKPLGQKGKRLKEGIDAVGCEVTEATFASGDEWANFNLNYNRLMLPRPVDGETDEQLRARSGEMVKATFEGNTEGKAKFTFTNQSKRPLEVRAATIYYYNESGKQLRFSSAMPRGPKGYLTLEPGASASAEVGYERDKFPEGTAVIEAGVSRVKFLDGDKEEWLNRNQAPLTRKMVAAAKPASE